MKMYIRSIVYRSISVTEKTQVTVSNKFHITHNILRKWLSFFYDQKPPKDFQRDSIIFLHGNKKTLLSETKSIFNVKKIEFPVYYIFLV